MILKFFLDRGIPIIYDSYEKGVSVMGDASFGEKVKVKRAEKGLSQAELAKMTGLTQATISRIESGEVTQLRSANLKRLAGVLGVTIDFLVGKKDRMSFEDTLAADKTAKVIFRGYEKLSEERRKQIRDFVEFLIRQDKAKGE